MDLATLELRLGGSLANTIMKRDVTPAELIVLRAMHGDECIASIQWQGKKELGSDNELDRLRGIYNTKNGQELFIKLFPGAAPKMPSTFKEIGYDVTEEGEVRARDKLQKQYQDELARKVREAAIAKGKNPDASVKMVNYPADPSAFA